jgi:hypothetical protein
MANPLGEQPNHAAPDSSEHKSILIRTQPPQAAVDPKNFVARLGNR